jgi:hypothetical protein
MPEIPEICISQSLPLPSESPKEEAAVFVRTLVRMGQPGRIEFDVKTRDRSNDFVLLITLFQDWLKICDTFFTSRIFIGAIAL